MKPTDAKIEFEKFIVKSRTTISSLTPAIGIQLMLEFYRQTRVDNCPLDQDADMLLYQCGTYDWGKGSYFQIGITRQFIETGWEGDDGISQLSLCFYFDPSKEFKQLEQGDCWCDSPNDLSRFESYIKDSTAYEKVQHTSPAKLEIEYSKV